mmetsp:Transcript_3198/g.10687  ORF Transcript_3198/g.10687 Transcript_3198/m.10687 type:complete len:603 (+) Transcript_3198:66-1874(+)
MYSSKRERADDADAHDADAKRIAVMDDSFFDEGFAPSTARDEVEVADDDAFYDARIGHAPERDAATLLAEAETRAGVSGTSVVGDGATTAKHVRQLVLAFERAYAENVKQRVKHANTPAQFAESEIELDAEVKRLGTLATTPELYPEFVKLNAVPSIVAVLGHDNEDIVADALELVRELTDGDAVESDEEGGRALATALRESGGYAALVAALVRFEDISGAVKASTSDASNAVSAVLGIVENLSEIVGTAFDADTGESSNEALEAFCAETDLLKWLLRRIEKKRDVDQNKLYASEILSIMLQSSAKCRRMCVAMDGLDALLQSTSTYKKREPEDDGEKELVENLFDAICAIVIHDENKATFVELEGIELMLILLAGKNKAPGANFVAVPALKCLDYVLSANRTACERFIDALGLKYVFGVFMGRHMKAWRKSLGNEGVLEQEIRSTSVVYSLFKNVQNADARDRLCAKFVEQDFAKCDRLIELWVEFAKRVSAEQARLDDEDVDTGIDLTEEEEYLQKLDAGLATLEHLTMIFAHLWRTAHAPIMRRLYTNATQNAITLSHLRDIIRQHARHVGDAGGPDARAVAVAAALDLLPFAPHEHDA